MDQVAFLSEYGFAPNVHELRIANGRDPMDESKPFTDGRHERYPRAWKRRGEALKAEGGTRHLTEPNVYPASKPSNFQPTTLADTPCRHRGQPIAEMKCKPCTRGANRDIMVPVCECALHQLHCTAANTGETFQGKRPRGCNTCGDREPMTAGTLPPITKRLTVGFATRQDSCRARWVVQTLREMHGSELAAAGIAWEIVIVDNGGDDELAPDGQSHTAHLRSVANSNPDLVRLISFAGQQGTFPPKSAIFDHAAGDIVVVIDSHVLIRAGGLKRLVDWFTARPDNLDIVHGPILSDGGTLLYTHQERDYRDNMLAQWDNYDQPTPICTVAKPDCVFGEREVEIPQAGAWLFACRRDAWPCEQLPKGLRGFGGDENIDRLFQSLGRKAWCLEWLAGWHDFYKLNPRYINDPFHRLRNDCLWHLACGDTYRIVEALEHYKVTDEQKQTLLKELGLSPMSDIESLYAIAESKSSDIRAHVPRLRRLATGAKRVVEFGTRTGVSTTAFAASGAEVVTYDIAATHESHSLCEAAPNVRQVIADTLTLDTIPDCDLLFIDTLHCAAQVAAELRHADKVSRFIAFHDTTTFGTIGDDGGPGIMVAVREFLVANPEWSERERFTDDNGLLILERGGTQAARLPRLRINLKPKTAEVAA